MNLISAAELGFRRSLPIMGRVSIVGALLGLVGSNGAAPADDAASFLELCEGRDRQSLATQQTLDALLK